MVVTVVLIVSLCLLFFCLHQLWTCSSDDHKLINRSNSLCSRFLYVSATECWRLPNTEPLMHGEVQSPQYPQPYPPNLQEQWDLSVLEGYQIRLTFTHLDIEASAGCHYDALTVRATFQHIRYHKQQTSVVVFELKYDWSASVET